MSQDTQEWFSASVSFYASTEQEVDVFVTQGEPREIWAMIQFVGDEGFSWHKKVPLGDMSGLPLYRKFTQIVDEACVVFDEETALSAGYTREAYEE